MVNSNHKLSIACKAKLLGFSRSSNVNLPRPVRDGDLVLLRQIDELPGVG